MNAPAVRRTQEERTTTTRRALLDATIACLVEYGFHGTTTTRVVARAGVSRGAHVHHFPTKNELVLAAVEHLAEKRADNFVRSGLDRLRESKDWVGDVLDLVWDLHQGPLFDASMELWIAARTDPELQSQVAEFERGVTARFVELCRSFLGPRADDRRVREDLYLVLETVRGLRLLTFIHADSEAKLDQRWQASKLRLRRILTDW